MKISQSHKSSNQPCCDLLVLCLESRNPKMVKETFATPVVSVYLKLAEDLGLDMPENHNERLSHKCLYARDGATKNQT
jgi:hypothetical protein